MKAFVTFLSVLLSIVSLHSQAKEVELLQATSEQFCSSCFSFSGEILVENIAYEKTVTVAVSIDGGEWEELEASYVESLPGGLERWRFWSLQPSADYKTYQFAIRYDVDG